jgi:hypothetical protein
MSCRPPSGKVAPTIGPAEEAGYRGHGVWFPGRETIGRNVVGLALGSLRMDLLQFDLALAVGLQ